MVSYPLNAYTPSSGPRLETEVVRVKNLTFPGRQNTPSSISSCLVKSTSVSNLGNSFKFTVT